MFGFGFGRGPGSRGNSRIFWIFLLMIIAPELFGLFYLVPIALIGFAGYWAIKAVINSFSSKKTYTNTNNEKPKTNTSNRSTAELARIDKKLTSYFKNNVSLPIIDEIALETSSGKYVTVDQLFLTYKGEKVLKLGEFKEEQFAVYEKIMDLLNEFSKQKESAKEKMKTENVDSTNKISEANKYINRINELNAKIPQEEITNGLYQTCDLINKIELSKETKQDEEKLSKLYNYYFPILVSILENYKKLLDRNTKDDEFRKCETQLIKTIMLINQALKTLYEQMHEDDYININADMDTLQTLIKKDGFFEDPFKK